MSAPTSLVSFGLVTDVQYADVEDGWDFHHTTKRYYRNALTQLHATIANWLYEAESGTKLRFAVNLGDLIDGKNRPASTSHQALTKTRAAWSLFQDAIGPVHHLVGNHELYNFSASFIRKEHISQPPTKSNDTPQGCYYDFQVDQAPSFRFVVLDCYGLSILGREMSDPVYQEALALLRRVNPNENLNSPTGLVEEQRRFVAFNGAIDQKQMIWLEETLKKATKAEENVVIFTHVPVHPSTTPTPSCLLWNYPEVLELIRRFACVRVVFSGHSHADGYIYAHEGMHNSGVHFVVCDAILECAPSETAHALVHVFEDKLVVQGYGKVPTRELCFPKNV
ncbi:manganese-dependent adp-ribose cdp-alcohol diphosphatase-like [Plasmopara halstedii]|uniref:Manganese-dependent adp-ribose cdp-alcohol diphosphatase-like n=1 Tax=Plasmopara halstedii TaxID=4781 RepID=A0A0P1AJL9_PLAHL|nr:manganese-dependent adp-ribose cdp-alcohol diphosphatase-like [Plasmopara halstedii]CEG40772.1 manganese-dependent adp-ribose cdp-alcohol diphosphatase-like [Plasmopara halstedii]|eukprot:XP_024577141.1 manganese-dependent adp-ribose cdp-alcohol diphosphatase-like [Plasmopara halstedii]